MNFKKIVQTLTNWQRNQWARDGYPGLRKELVDKVMPYTTRAKAQREEERKG